MALTSEQAFKAGFLQRCAEEGLTIEETKQRVKQAIVLAREKRAFIGPVIQKLFGSGVDLASKGISAVVPAALSTAGTAAIAAPIIGGAGAGYLGAKLTGEDSDAVEEAKQDEVMGEYERLADEARRRARLKQLQSATGRRVIALTPGER